MSDCTSCKNGISNDDSEIPLPTAGGEIIVSVEHTSSNPTVPPKVVEKLCSTIKDSCTCAAPDPVPLAKISNTLAFAIPACNQTVEVLFDKDVTGLMPGLEIYGVDTAQRTIRLKIQSVVSPNKLVLLNTCSSCCNGTKPVGESVLANTLFSWHVPQCCTSSSSSSNSDCLIGTFYFPVSGQSAAAQVSNSNSFIPGGLYSMGGYIWKVSARVNSTQLLLENPAPGNGAPAGGFIEGGCTGECIYPITPISEASACDDAAVEAVALIGCTTSGQRKLTGDTACGVVKFDVTTGNFEVDHILGGSPTTGPHYIEWNAADPCQSKLVHAPQLAGSDCGIITEPLFLTPANTSNSYEVTVSRTDVMSASAPNNIITLAGRQFTVTAIIVAGTPGKIRLTPRFTVNTSETIIADSQWCVVEGCQPFSASAWPFPCPINTHGQPVYCAEDGLRTAPRPLSLYGYQPFTQSADIGGIEALGTYARDQITVPIANPSTCYGAIAHGFIQYVDSFTLDADGAWDQELLQDETVVPVNTRASIRVQSQNGERRIDSQITAGFIVFVPAGGTINVNVLPRLRTVNASANTNLAWTNTQGAVSWMIVSV